ncbi:MAG: hypothetical protein ACI8SE_001063 [Bacteroidia bacterium]|jgi:hypothetical protein
MYYLGETPASLIIILYYFQSLFIGLQYFIRLSAIGMMYHKLDPKHNRFTVALFFLFHYGFFHLVYFIFLISIVVEMPGSVDPGTVKFFVVALLGYTVLSTISDIKKDLTVPKVSVVVMFQPYFRIVPMHLFIMLAFATDSLETLTKAFLLFIVLKTIADIGMHIAVNKTYRDQRTNATGGWI